MFLAFESHNIHGISMFRRDGEISLGDLPVGWDIMGPRDFPGEARMINVSVSAAGKINELLTEEGKVGSGLRVFVQGGGCSGFQYGLMIEEGGGEADQILRVERREAVRRPGEHQLPQGRGSRLRRHRNRRRLHDQEPERHVDLRLRQFVQRVTCKTPARGRGKGLRIRL